MEMEFPANLCEWLVAILAAQLVVSLYMFFTLRAAARARSALSKEMFGLMRKIEGLTAQRREQVLTHLDRVLDSLSVRLPTNIASKVSDLVFETERQILARLAELEPHLKNNEANREKMEELILTMEKLEETVVGITAEGVQQVVLESRRALFEEDGASPNLARLLT
jgi:hypothetical protein